MAQAPARWRRGRYLLRLLPRVLLVASVGAAALTLLLHHRHGPKPPEPYSSTSRARPAFSDELFADSPPGKRDPLQEDAAAVGGAGGKGSCATVERMGEEAVGRGSTELASLRVRELIRRHFELHGAARVRTLPAYEFCRQGFVLGKSSEAGFGNEMYKILTAAALSIMLNRSLIIGQTRHLYGIISF